jgi:transcriptional regulator with XRE-family HTH domain|tara:strand:+ start:10160 stop:10867 length:708 start_codon:yes stop_codon:yes gene_type:complete
MYKYGGIYMTIELGKMIKVFRESKNLSRKEFCKIVDISTSGLAYYENGGRVPSGKILHKIRKGFGLPESYFTSEIKKEKEGELTVNQQSMLIELQAEKIRSLEEQIKNLKPSIHAKPAYHFKMVSRYVAETDEWLDTDIFGDFSMTGYTYEEIVPIMNEENDKNSWIDRYHPDSKKRLHRETLKNIRTDYHYLKWDHMMWRAKNGKYECYNIDLLYIRAEEKVTSMFYWVNGDND